MVEKKISEIYAGITYILSHFEWIVVDKHVKLTTQI